MVLTGVITTELSMDVLFLDDDPQRCKTFLSRVPGAKIVTTSAECIVALTESAWDEVHLDHDLGGEIFCDSGREDCGMEVVRWIVEHKPKVLEFTVHTYNPGAGKAMTQDLKAAGYVVHRIPFEH